MTLDVAREENSNRQTKQDNVTEWDIDNVMVLVSGVHWKQMLNKCINFKVRYVE